MARIPFTKLKCKINTNEIPVQIGEETIAVKQYLPIQEKLELISKVIFAYTNISFTDKQKEDLPKLYDILYSSGVIAEVLKNIPEDEYMEIVFGVRDSIEAIYKYQNSVLGVLDTIKTDYSDTEFDLSKMQEALASSDLSVIKDIVSKLG